MGYSPPIHSLPLPSASLHRLAKFQTHPSTFEAFPNGWGSLVLGCPAGTLRIPKDPPMGQGEWTCVPPGKPVKKRMGFQITPKKSRVKK